MPVAMPGMGMMMPGDDGMGSESQRVLIVVTHLLGTGHLKRSINLAQAFVAAGNSVTLVSGGFPVPQFSSDGLEVIQLPPLRSDGVDFRQLLTADGSVAGDDYFQSRADMLKDLVLQLMPAVIITELFPFGRRTLRTEFLSLLQAAQSLSDSPTIVASVRDILSAPSSEAKAQATEEIVMSYYDGVLVHSDERNTPLNVSWPVTDKLARKLLYTGYVASAINPLDRSKQAGTGEIVVSAGGGAVGRQVFECAISAAQLTPDCSWRLLIGGAESTEEVVRLQRRNRSPLVSIEPARSDFRQLLQNAACSVSLCGYNTVVDLLQTGTPALVIPFDEGGELEQVLRAESLARLPSFSVLRASELTPDTLNKSVALLRKVGRVVNQGMRFDGAAETVRIVAQLRQNPI